MSDFIEDEVTYRYFQTSGAYEGAAYYYKEQLKTLAHGQSDQLSASEIINLRLRSKHAFRNNGYVAAAQKKFTENQGEVYVNWVNKKGKKHNLMQDLWDEFYSNPCLDGYGDFGTLQSVLWSEYFLTGEAHVRMIVKRSDKRIPLKLQSIPTSLHAISRISTLTTTDIFRNILYGIEFQESVPVNYFYLKDQVELHDLAKMATNYQVTQVPASEIARLFRRNEPGQWIGIPELAPILLPLYELDDLNDATIARQKVAQAVAWVISNSSPLALTPTGSPITLNKKDGSETKVAFKGVGGSTLYLNKGEQLTQVQSSDIGANLPVLMQHELFRISAALGIPYHSLTGDLSGLNFSSIRAIALEFRQRVEYMHHFFLLPCVLTPITDMFYNLAKLYYPLVGNAKATFQLPKFASVDPLKDTQNAVLSIQNGLGTLKSFLDQRHLEFEDILEDRTMLEQLGLTNLLNPSATGMAQANNNNANTNSSSN